MGEALLQKNIGSNLIYLTQVRGTMIKQKIKQGSIICFCRINCQSSILYEAQYMNNYIDSFIDNCVFSGINGNDDQQSTLKFYDDPIYDYHQK